MKRLLLVLSCLSLAACGSGVDVSGAKPGPVVQPPPTGGNNAPVISGSPPAAVEVGQPYSFTPTASDADGDTLAFSVSGQPGWASFDTATGQISGQPTAADEGIYDNIQISVSDGTDSAQANPFSILVTQVALNAALIRWTAPTTNSDGSTLSDLTGFRIYYLAESTRAVAFVEVPSPGVSEFRVDGLISDTYSFAVTAYNSAGVESLISEQARVDLN